MVGVSDPGALVAQLRAAVADDLSEAAGRELSGDDRRELARTMILARLHRIAAESVEVGQTALAPEEEQRLARRRARRSFRPRPAAGAH